MRTRTEVSPEKLRGGFYSPDPLVNVCLDRAFSLVERSDQLSILEPSAGDGAFIRGIAQHPQKDVVANIEAVEIIPSEAAKVANEIERLSLPGKVVNGSFLNWYNHDDSEYDIVLANPPYVRFQFISEEDKQRAKTLTATLGVTGSAVSNLWIPIFLLALDKLREGGSFSVILPLEFLTGISASRVRSWLLTNTTDLTIDLFRPGTFPAVLQEVLVLSGRKTTPVQSENAIVTFQDRNGGVRTWTHRVTQTAKTWTGYLLTPSQESALVQARSLTGVAPLGSIARFSVSTVTGANAYFCVSDATLKNQGLKEWALPLLSRSRHAKGLVFSKEDQQRLHQSDYPSWLLSFSADRTSPEKNPQALQYLQEGVEIGLDQRYKCRVRSPWYRVPVVQAGDLLLSKRSNRFPRVIANHAKAITTDTIYRGQMLAGVQGTANDLTASFHNSLTLLSAEVEGRSFGGGVLELVPSEVSSLLVPLSPQAHEYLPELDALTRQSSNEEDLIIATDRMIASLFPELDATTMDILRGARESLMARRLDRSTAPFYTDNSPELATSAV